MAAAAAAVQPQKTFEEIMTKTNKYEDDEAKLMQYIETEGITDTRKYIPRINNFRDKLKEYYKLLNKIQTPNDIGELQRKQILLINKFEQDIIKLITSLLFDFIIPNVNKLQDEDIKNIIIYKQIIDGYAKNVGEEKQAEITKMKEEAYEYFIEIHEALIKKGKNIKELAEFAASRASSRAAAAKRPADSSEEYTSYKKFAPEYEAAAAEAAEAEEAAEAAAAAAGHGASGYTAPEYDEQAAAAAATGYGAAGYGAAGYGAAGYGAAGYGAAGYGAPGYGPAGYGASGTSNHAIEAALDPISRLIIRILRDYINELSTPTVDRVDRYLEEIETCITDVQNVPIELKRIPIIKSYVDMINSMRVLFVNLKSLNQLRANIEVFLSRGERACKEILTGKIPIIQRVSSDIEQLSRLNDTTINNAIIKDIINNLNLIIADFNQNIDETPVLRTQACINLWAFIDGKELREYIENPLNIIQDGLTDNFKSSLIIDNPMSKLGRYGIIIDRISIDIPGQIIKEINIGERKSDTQTALDTRNPSIAVHRMIPDNNKYPIGGLYINLKIVDILYKQLASNVTAHSKLTKLYPQVLNQPPPPVGTTPPPAPAPSPPLPFERPTGQLPVLNILDNLHISIHDYNMIDTSFNQCHIKFKINRDEINYQLYFYLMKNIKNETFITITGHNKRFSRPKILEINELAEDIANQIIRRYNLNPPASYGHLNPNVIKIGFKYAFEYFFHDLAKYLSFTRKRQIPNDSERNNFDMINRVRRMNSIYINKQLNVTYKKYIKYKTKYLELLKTLNKN